MAKATVAAQITANNQQITAQCPPNQLVNPTAVAIYNKSPYELFYLDTLIMAWHQKSFDIAAGLGGSPSVVLTSSLAPGVNVESVATVYVEFLGEGEPVPDEGPLTTDEIAGASAVAPAQILYNNLSLSPGATGVTISLNVQNGLTLACCIQQPSTAVDITCTGAGGFVDSNASGPPTIYKLGGDGAASIFTLIPVSPFVTFNFTGNGAAIVFSAWAVNGPATPRELINPGSFLYAPAALAANSISTSGSFGLHGSDGTLTGFAATALGTGPPAGAWAAVLQRYIGGGNWADIGGVGGGASTPADKGTIRCPAGTGRLVLFNQAAAGCGIQAAFNQ